MYYEIGYRTKPKPKDRFSAPYTFFSVAFTKDGTKVVCKACQQMHPDSEVRVAQCFESAKERLTWFS